MNWREDKTLIVLWSTGVFLGIVVVVVVYLRPEDTMLYTLFSTQFSGFLGALVLHLTREKVAPAGSTTEVQTHVVSKVPPDPASPVPTVPPVIPIPTVPSIPPKEPTA